ncbi:hypothetical protein QJQ45_003323 [Haematococcus lacustris]|nr:hypothetical protein QJQ45_003323 [Haematococcus lacustris]
MVPPLATEPGVLLLLLLLLPPAPPPPPPLLLLLLLLLVQVTLAPLEFMPAEVFTDQLVVNLVGPMRVTQAFLPLLRPHAPPAQGQTSARIINISSQAGTVALPLFGGYCASKFGLEALSDCLRYELHGQGIDVVLHQAWRCQGGPVAMRLTLLAFAGSSTSSLDESDIWSRAHLASDKVLDGLPPAVHQLYGRVIEQVGPETRPHPRPDEGDGSDQPASGHCVLRDGSGRHVGQVGVARVAFTPLVNSVARAVQIDVASRQAEAKGDSCEEVAQLIYKAATDAKPRARYFLGQAATVQMVARRLLPDWLWDRLLLDGLAKRQLEGGMPKGGA